MKVKFNVFYILWWRSTGICPKYILHAVHVVISLCVEHSLLLYVALQDRVIFLFHMIKLHTLHDTHASPSRPGISWQKIKYLNELLISLYIFARKRIFGMINICFNCETHRLIDQKLSSTIFPCRCPATGDISNIWCFRSYTPYIF